MIHDFGSRSSIAQGVSIVLGTYNRKKFLQLTIDSLREEVARADFPYEIIIIDGGSTDGTISWLVSQKDIITIVQHNRGTWQGKKIRRRSWGYFMNLGFKCAQYKYICMLSDDCLVVPYTIINGYNLFERQLQGGQNVGAVAFYWRNWPDQEEYWVGLTLGNKLFVNHGMFLNHAIKDVGYIDEDSYTFYYADGDLCLKLWQKGYSVIDSLDSFIEHYSHANMSVRKSNSKNQRQDNENYLKKWEGIFYDLENPIIGSWEKKLFVDSTKTWEKFQQPGVENISDKFFRFLSVLKGKIIHV
jgi:glycosyltransferase involved in cell wall biosynthesis